MKKYTVLFLLSILFFLIGSRCLLAQPYAIGTQTVTYQDPDRSNRSIQTVFYYPATQAGSNQPFVSGDFPLLVFGHGFMMNYDAYALYWQTLVPLGYILALPRTEEGTGPNHGNFGQDLSFLINRIKWESVNNPSSFLYGHVGTSSALMGHSMGGGASFLGAAQSTNINALVNFAAAETTPSAIAAAAHIKVPALIFMGTNDGVTPPATHQIPMFNALSSSCKTLLKINGGGHCYFAESNTACSTGEFFTTPQPTITRVQQHSVIMAFLIPYLDYILKGNMASKLVFQDSLSTSTRITYVQSCTDFDIAMTEIISPQSSCSLQNENVKVKFQNIGGSPIAPTQVIYQLNGMNTVSETVAGTLNPGEIRVHTFASTVNVSAPGTYILSGSINHTDDTITSNNTLNDTIINSSVLLPQAVNFTGFNGANLQTIFAGWQEAQGITPSATTSAWASSTGLGSPNNVTAKVNFYSSPIREWIISPAFNITPQTRFSFEAAVTVFSSFNPYVSGMGDNDKLYIKISNDCGISWTNLDSIVKSTNLSNQLTSFMYDLSAYSGQTLKVAFQAYRASSVTNDYDFHLDNILIRDVPPIDVSPIQLINPSNANCYTAAETLTVEVINLGTDTLFFDTNTMDIAATVTGPGATQLFNNTINSGMLLPGQTGQYDVSSALNMNGSGTYTFDITTTVAVDGNLINNNLSSTVINTMPLVHITGDSVVCSGNSITLDATIVNQGTGALTIFPNNTSMAIPDNNTSGVSSQITVNNAANITPADIISVKLNIIHTFVGDLILKLTAPDNSFIILSNRRGGDSNNYNNVVFSMSAVDSISNTPAPFAGAYIPEEPFSALTGTVNGIWTLNVSDNLSTDTGTLLGWEITLNTDNGIVSYEWSTGTNTAHISDTPLQSGTYQLTITDVLTCTSVLDFYVNVLAGYSFSLGNDTAICQGQSITFDAGSFNTVVWHDQSTGQYFTTDTATQVYAQVTNDCGVYSDTLNLNVLPLPVLNIGDSITVCTNTNYTLDAGSGFNAYLWSTQQNAQAIIVNSAVETQNIYSVTVTDANGCSNTDEILITFTVCSGVLYEDGQTLIVYPNPASETVNIEVSSNKSLNMKIFNSVGEKIKEESIISPYRMDISHLPAGIYNLLFDDGKQYNKSVKIIKQ